MVNQDKLDIEIFKVVTRAVSFSRDLDVMAGHLCQLLVGALEIKGATLFLLNPETKELEILKSMGLSKHYLNKGPVFIDRSMGCNEIGKAHLLSDVEESKELQYPEDAKKEGVKAILSLPIALSGRIIGCLRLYHYEPWHISEKDIDGLLALSDMIGLALMYSRLKTTMSAISEMVGSIHPVWLE